MQCFQENELTLAALIANAALAPTPTKARDMISVAYDLAYPEPILAATAMVVKI